MKITRFTQSCILLEDKGTRILIDPSGDEKENVAKFGKLDSILYTHEHGDHFDAELAKQFARSGVPLYANESTSRLIDTKKTTVYDGQEINVGGMEIKVLELPHCLMADGSKGPQNVGYLINEKFFHPGDGDKIDNLEVEVLALPVTGPDISIKDAFDFGKQLEARKTIPIHYDLVGMKPEVFAKFADRYKCPFEVVCLAHGENIEI
jgi:L-ascorbate metabolism protein UlaG (beta-lactamase superfamily)